MLPVIGALLAGYGVSKLFEDEKEEVHHHHSKTVTVKKVINNTKPTKRRGKKYKFYKNNAHSFVKVCRFCNARFHAKSRANLNKTHCKC